MQYNPKQNNSFSRFMQFEQNKNKPVQKLDKLATTVSSRCVNIDSRDRNRSLYPNSNKFQVQVNPDGSFKGAGLFTNFRNVKSIRIVEAILPAVAQTEAYISLVVPELDDTMVGTNDVLKKSFAILIPERTDAPGNFVHCKTKDMCNCFKKFDPPLANLRRFTFEFYGPDGVLTDFGTDTSEPTAPDKTKQVFLCLEIVTETPNTSKLNSRAVF